MKTVITFGTYDLFHIGHLHLLRRAAQLGDHLVVGISSDAFSYRKKGRCPIFKEEDRRLIVGALQFVNETFLEESMDLKRQYILDHRADVLVMGDDWKGKFDEFSDICEVVYLPRTTDISTTELVETIRDLKL